MPENETMDRLIGDVFSNDGQLDDEMFEYERQRLLEDIESGEFDPDEVAF